MNEMSKIVNNSEATGNRKTAFSRDRLADLDIVGAIATKLSFKIQTDSELRQLRD